MERCLRLTAPITRSGWEELEEEEGRNDAAGANSWTGFGIDGLDSLVDDWDGRGVMELSGSQKTGKSVSPHESALGESGREVSHEIQAELYRWLTDGLHSCSRSI